MSLTAGLAGCASPGAPVPPAWTAALPALLPADLWLWGEQHDAPEHQRLEREAVQWLAERGQLAALVLEMAEHGHSTHGLPPEASEAQAQAALQWQNAAWPWTVYGPVVMAAVRAGVPVLGGNLPRSAMRAAMADSRWDRHLPPPALEDQYTALREGHCGLLPEAQIPAMARIQIARDARLAETALIARQPGRTVLLVAGAGHVRRRLGIPTHLAADIQPKVLLAHTGKAPEAIKNEATWMLETPALPPRDACAALRPR
ncbi:MAG: ChaN family lipoprotein [Burkholderiaceae bacterium]|nr:ChaN family lipoprotein [Burkholderiaceae bacterium]